MVITDNNGDNHPNGVLDGLNEAFWPFWLFSLESLSLFAMVFVALSSY